MSTKSERRIAPLPELDNSDWTKKWIGDLGIPDYEPTLNYIAKETDSESQVVSGRVSAKMYTSAHHFIGPKSSGKQFLNVSDFIRDAVAHNLWRLAHLNNSPKILKEVHELQSKERAKQAARKREEDSTRLRDVKDEIQKFVDQEGYEAFEEYLKAEREHHQHLYQPYRDRMGVVLEEGEMRLAELKKRLNVTI